MNKKPTIAIIGAGNMGGCLAGGLIATGYPAQNLWLSDPSLEKLDHLKQQLNVNITSNNKDAIQSADVIMLAVKPQLMAETASDLASSIHQQMVMSIAAGITIVNLQAWLGKQVAIVRVMPNTPALIGCGASGLFANKVVSPAQHALAEMIMRAVGVTVWLDREEQMDIVTALSGSGPAYFFLIIEALQQAAIELGLPEKVAKTLTLQTAYGSARMAIESEKEILELRQQVTSPGGTTEHGLRALEEKNIRQVLAHALKAAKKRSEELAG